MPISEQDKKRTQELVIQLEIVKDKIRKLSSLLFKEGKIVPHNFEQANELGQLYKEEKKLMDELSSIP